MVKSNYEQSSGDYTIIIIFFLWKFIIHLIAIIWNLTIDFVYFSRLSLYSDVNGAEASVTFYERV